MKAIAAGGHSLALTTDGVVTAWGYDSAGQADVPAVLTGKRVLAIAAGGDESLALTSDGVVVAWGAETAIPAALRHQRVVAIAAGWANNLALTADGAVVGWDETARRPVPAAVQGRAGVLISTAGEPAHSAAVVTPDGHPTSASARRTHTSRPGRACPSTRWPTTAPGRRSAPRPARRSSP